MKKLFIMLQLCMCITNAYAFKSEWDGKSDTSWYDESLSEYHLMSAAQLKGLSDLVGFNGTPFEGKKVYLDCDVDLKGLNWTPIGLRNGQAFDGVFDGQNHEITNLYINTNSLDYPGMKDNIGLFGYGNDVYNLKIQGSIDVYQGSYIGGIAGFLKGKLENIYSDINIVIKQSQYNTNIGNVIGRGDSANRIYSTGEISFDSNMYIMDQVYIGGIAGSCGSMTECFSCVNLSVRKYGNSHSYTGGISGYGGTIKDAIFTGSITIDNYQCTTDMFMAEVGGIAGGLSTGSNLISAPTYFFAGRGWANGKSVVVPANSDATISDTYYLITWATGKENYGEGMSEENMKSDNPLPRFDTNIWEFASGEYPSLRNVKSLTPLPTHFVEYYVDDVLYKTVEYKDGETIIPLEEPTKEGYTFSGWDYVPPFLMGTNWRVKGYFTINEYVLTFMVDNEIFSKNIITYNDRIYYPTIPDKQGYIFAWEGEKEYYMPANDLVINGYYTKEEPEVVDLGLPSGLLWATKNIGAANPADYGKYYSWGEVAAKDSYYWGTYKYSNSSNNSLVKYCYSEDFGIVDNKMILENEDDAAKANWGESYRMPTAEEALELYYNCNWSLGVLDGVDGCYVTGPNGNCIFLPKAGQMQYKTKFHSSTEMYILTSTLYKGDDDVHPDYAMTIFCDANEYGLSGENRCNGFTVRAVKSPNESGINNQLFSGTNEVQCIYDLNGRKISEKKKGMYIIKYKDGSCKKTIK